MECLYVCYCVQVISFILIIVWTGFCVKASIDLSMLTGLGEVIKSHHVPGQTVSNCWRTRYFHVPTPCLKETLSEVPSSTVGEASRRQSTGPIS